MTRHPTNPSRPALRLVLAGLLLGSACGSDLVDPTSPGTLDLAIGRDSTTGAVLETDQDDYLPGDSVRISGRGWAGGEPVTLRLSRDPETSPDNEWHVTADSAGGFRTAFLVVDSDLGVTFTLDATGPVSGSVVTVAFTDGNLQQVTLSPSTLVVSPGSPAAFTANVIMGGTAGTCNITLSIVPPLPSGITAAPIPSPNPTPVSPGNISFTKTVTFNTSASTPNGSYTVTVRAAEGGTCNTPINQAFGSATLVVGSTANAAPELAPIGNQSVNEEEALAFTAGATDESAGTLAYALASPQSGVFPQGAAISSTGSFSWTPTEAQGPGTYRVKVVVTDNGGLTDEEEIEIAVVEVNRAPVLAPIGPQTVAEGSLLALTATATDPDLPANGLSFSLVNGPAGAAITPDGHFSWTPPDGPAEVQMTVRVTDDGSPAMSHEEVVTVSVTNVAPVITALELPAAPLLAGTPMSVTWRFDDPGTDTWTCEISWDGDGTFVPATYSGSKTCQASAGLPAGLYTVTVKVSDGDGSGERTATASIVVYDPEGGFVTGGGWLDSPAGALAGNSGPGKVTFAFSVKYVKGRVEPQGYLEVQLHDSRLMLRAVSFQWLVVSGSLAQFKGVGTLQNQPGLYGFMVTVVRDGTDQFRICVWNQATGAIVYDTHPGEQLDSRTGSTLSGGSITIHGR